MTNWPAAAFLGAILLATGCAAIRDDVPPDWVSGKSARYPDAKYLIGRGQAPDPEGARNRARADLAQIFETSVKVETSDVTRFSSSGGRANKPQLEADVSRRIVTRTEQIIQGIQIAEVWQDPQTRMHHALAILPRQQAAAALRQDIERLDGATRSYVGQARESTDLLQKVAAASRALETQAARDASQKALRVIDTTGRGVEPEFNSGELAADLDSLLRRIRVRPQADRGLEPMLSGALSAAGFMPDSASDAPYVLTGSLQLDDLGLIDRWYWVRGILEIRLAEGASGKIRGTKRWEVNGSGREKASAQRRALDQADELLRQELRSTILGFAAGERDDGGKPASR